MPILRTRAFNDEGPRRGEVFVTANFANQVAEIKAGRQDPVIHVGDLTPRRYLERYQSRAANLLTRLRRELKLKLEVRAQRPRSKRIKQRVGQK